MSFSDERMSLYNDVEEILVDYGNIPDLIQNGKLKGDNDSLLITIVNQLKAAQRKEQNKLKQDGYL